MMHKFYPLSLLLMLFLGLNMPGAKAQQPAVTVSVDSVAATSFTVSFLKNEDCSHYVILAAEPATMDAWVTSMGATLSQLVASWGIECQDNHTNTWTEMSPNTGYIVYVLASNSDTSILSQTPVTTASLGTSDSSVISIQVTDITSNSARVVATPNEATALFFDMLITTDYYDLIGADSALALLKENDPMFETDNWNWLSLTPATDYYALAVGMNADSVWGNVSRVAFSTLSIQGILPVADVTVSLYPNPAISTFTVASGTPIHSVTLCSLAGQQLFCRQAHGARQLTLPIDGYPAGLYLVKTFTSQGCSVQKLVVK